MKSQRDASVSYNGYMWPFCLSPKDPPNRVQLLHHGGEGKGRDHYWCNSRSGLRLRPERLDSRRWRGDQAGLGVPAYQHDCNRGNDRESIQHGIFVEMVCRLTLNQGNGVVSQFRYNHCHSRPRRGTSGLHRYGARHRRRLVHDWGDHVLHAVDWWFYSTCDKVC